MPRVQFIMAASGEFVGEVELELPCQLDVEALQSEFMMPLGHMIAIRGEGERILPLKDIGLGTEEVDDGILTVQLVAKPIIVQNSWSGEHRGTRKWYKEF